MSVVRSIGTVDSVMRLGVNKDIGYVQRDLGVGTSNARMSYSYVS